MSARETPPVRTQSTAIDEREIVERGLVARAPGPQAWRAARRMRRAVRVGPRCLIGTATRDGDRGRAGPTSLAPLAALGRQRERGRTASRGETIGRPVRARGHDAGRRRGGGRDWWTRTRSSSQGRAAIRLSSRRAIEGVPPGGWSALRTGSARSLRQVQGDRHEHLILFWTDGKRPAQPDESGRAHRDADAPNTTVFPDRAATRRDEISPPPLTGATFTEIARRSGRSSFPSDPRWLDRVRLDR